MSGRARLPESRPSDAAPLSAEALAEIARERAKYPPKRAASAVMAALRIAQKERGWLSRETIEMVAEHLGIPAIRALEAATFYNMYDLSPTGRWKLCVCTNLPCALRGAEETAAALRRELGVEFGGTTADGEFTLTEGECFGSCDMAPAVIVNNERMLGPVPAGKVGLLLEGLRREQSSRGVPDIAGIPGMADIIKNGGGGGKLGSDSE